MSTWLVTLQVSLTGLAMESKSILGTGNWLMLTVCQLSYFLTNSTIFKSIANVLKATLSDHENYVMLILIRTFQSR